MAAIQAGRAGAAVIALDGATRLGAKILVAGGGRCNVTHHAVSERDYAGSTPASIRRILARFEVAQTVQFFRDLGVELKREETGKLFPTTDDAHTVLDALVGASRGAGVTILHPWRVESVSRDRGEFVVREAATGATLRARRVILATGGRSLPKTGSDGHGYAIARSLGHSVTPHVFPALVPLTLARDHFLCGLSGVTLPATVELRSATGKRLAAFTDSTLLTHFGLSGPGVLNISRHFTAAKLDSRANAEPFLLLNAIPGRSLDGIDAELRGLGRVSPARRLASHLPERLARALCEYAGLDPGEPGHTLSRDARRALAAACTSLRLPVTGDRGWLFAEATAGGVPLAELRLDTLESRVCPGLHVCGEVCDVDGRIGGFNFQWAWASGFVAGRGAASGTGHAPAAPYTPAR